MQEVSKRSTGVVVSVISNILLWDLHCLILPKFLVIRDLGKVGMGGFEPPTSRTLSEYANRAALHPETKREGK